MDVYIYYFLVNYIYIYIYETVVVKDSNSLINHNFNYHQDEFTQHKQN